MAPNKLGRDFTATGPNQKWLTDGVLLINTARGAPIDEGALVTELRRRRIIPILDVTDPEPSAVDHPLRGLPNCVITPHIAGSVANGCYRLGRSAVDQLLSYAARGVMSGQITRQPLEVLG